MILYDCHQSHTHKHTRLTCHYIGILRRWRQQPTWQTRLSLYRADIVTRIRENRTNYFDHTYTAIRLIQCNIISISVLQSSSQIVFIIIFYTRQFPNEFDSDLMFLIIFYIYILLDVLVRPAVDLYRCKFFSIFIFFFFAIRIVLNVLARPSRHRCNAAVVATTIVTTVGGG